MGIRWIAGLLLLGGLLQGQSLEERWSDLQQQGVSLRKQGKYEDAHRVLQEALAAAESMGPAGDRLAQTLNDLGAVNYEGAHYSEAETYYRRALEIWGRAQSPAHDRDLAALWNNFAAVFIATGRAQEAEPLYRRALALVEHTPSADPLTGAIWRQLGWLLIERKRYAEAAECEQHALEIWARSAGKDSPEVGAALEDLAVANLALDSYGAAREAAQRALANREKALGPESPKLVPILNTLAAA